ncbi:GNAT family N-acetyltransferase [Shewanella sp. OPT22]|nr:GNAT family N-acetyltransferase [Shewanella sp. OPT22]
MQYQISKAKIEDVKQVAVLFDKYRQFYEQKSDMSLAEHFIRSRISDDSALIFLAKNEEGELGGFCQVYPTFSSLLAKKVFVLNDVFVAHNHRRKGIAKALTSKVISMARIEGVNRVELQTHHDNLIAKNLYEGLGFKCDDQFLSYEREII